MKQVEKYIKKDVKSDVGKSRVKETLPVNFDLSMVAKKIPAVEEVLRDVAVRNPDIFGAVGVRKNVL